MDFTHIKQQLVATRKREEMLAKRIATLVAVIALLCLPALAQDPEYRIGVALTASTSLSFPGAEIVSIVAGSPASRANLQVGDVILTINNTRVSNISEAATTLTSLCAQRVVTGSFRPSTNSVYSQTIALLPAFPCLGVSYKDGRSPAIQIAAVVPGSPAEKASLAVGDIIQAIDGEPVFGSQSKAVEGIQKHGRLFGTSAPVSVDIWRQDRSMRFLVPVYTTSPPAVSTVSTQLIGGESDKGPPAIDQQGGTMGGQENENDPEIVLTAASEDSKASLPPVAEALEVDALLSGHSHVVSIPRWRTVLPYANVAAIVLLTLTWMLFRGRMRLPLKLALATTMLTCTVLAVLLLTALRTNKASVLVVNVTPYKVLYVVHYPVAENECVNEGWFALEPGESREIKQSFVQGVEPSFFIHGKSQSDLVPWLVQKVQGYDVKPGNTNTIYFEATANQSEILQNIGQENVQSKTVPTQPVELAATISSFAKAPLTEGTGVYQIHDDNLDLYGGTESLRADEAVGIFSFRAKQAAAALERQRQFDLRWPNPAQQFPYHLGVSLSTDDRIESPGVQIDAAFPNTLFGDKLPLEAGQVIVSLNGTPVFAYADLHYSLYDHATSHSGGIEVPVELGIAGASGVVKTTFFFNRAHWGDSDGGGFTAAVVGGLNAPCMGMGAGCETVMRAAGRTAWNAAGSLIQWLSPKTEWDYATHKDPQAERWDIAQRNARLRQFHQDAYEVGGIGGMFVPGPSIFLRGPLSKGLTRAGISKGAARLGAAASLEVAETAIWTILDSSPLRTQEEIAADVARIAPFAAAVGVVTGSMSRRSYK